MKLSSRIADGSLPQLCTVLQHTPEIDIRYYSSFIEKQDKTTVTQTPGGISGTAIPVRRNKKTQDLNATLWSEMCRLL